MTLKTALKTQNIPGTIVEVNKIKAYRLKNIYVVFIQLMGSYSKKEQQPKKLCYSVGAVNIKDQCVFYIFMYVRTTNLRWTFTRQRYIKTKYMY